MPYVQRDPAGKIIGLLTGPSYYSDGDWACDPNPLPDDHPDVIAFRAAHPPPDALTRRWSDADWKRALQEDRRLEKEHAQIDAAARRFQGEFTQLETALSTLLYAAINKPDSSVAYAIYYSPNSFDARTEIVDNVLVQLMYEQDKLAALRPVWKSIFERIAPHRRMRNALAHGSQQTLGIRGKRYARFAPLPFDAIRLVRKAADGQIPGLTASSIIAACDQVAVTRQHLETTNRILSMFFVADPRWRETLDRLTTRLTKPHGPDPASPIQGAPPPPPEPSPE